MSARSVRPRGGALLVLAAALATPGFALAAPSSGALERYAGKLDEPSTPVAPPSTPKPTKPASAPVQPTKQADGTQDERKPEDKKKAESEALPALSEAPRALADGASGGGVSANAVALPSGASSVTGLGESFTTQLSTGIVSLSVPLRLPTARGGVQPRLDLSYSSAGGFGIAGSGWNIGSSAISRQTDRGVPHYNDTDDWQPEQDRFLFGAMELVPICTVAGTTCAGAPGEVMPPWASGWQHFRARVEGGFLRFFWSPDHRTWRVNSKEGATFEFGVPLDGTGDPNALEVNPDNPKEVYRWYLARQYDAENGVHAQASPQPVNTIVYRYDHSGGATYLTDIYDTPPAPNPQMKWLQYFAHHTALTYEVRPDPVMSYKSGWLVEHTLRLARIDVTSKTFQGAPSSARELVRRYHLGYDPDSHTSLLTSVAMEGRCSTAIVEDGTERLPPTSCPRLPAVRLDYQHSRGTGPALADGVGKHFETFDDQIRKIADSPPHSLDEPLVGLMDVNGDGLPDVLATAPGLYDGGFGAFLNGKGGAKRFSASTKLSVFPTGDVDASVLKFSSPNVSVLDYDSDGHVDFVHMAQKKSYSVFSFGSKGLTGREIATASKQDVKIDFTRDARNIQVIDVNGDGLVDFVSSTPTEYQTFFALGRYPGGDGQFGQAKMTGATTAEISNEPVRFCTPWSGQAVRFSDPDVRVADVNGDGLADIVRLRPGQILYWPGRGNGFFGVGVRDNCAAGTLGSSRHIEMQNAPQFGISDAGTVLFNDVNADGFADLVEIRNDAVDVYLNDNGLGWTSRHAIEGTPIRPPGSNYVRMTDIDGSGSPDILWGRAYDYQYIDLTGGVIPHLLVKMDNGLGATSTYTYASSTDVMREADATGQGWKDRAPTVTPVLVQSTVRDNLERIGRPAGVYITQYKYRDAVFEGRQREFRGFREATVKVLGDSNSPTSTQRSLFQLGECTIGIGDDPTACDPQSRWKDNWRESLKGLPALSEAFDEQGVYLSTEHNTYQLQRLYAGRDGRSVMIAYPITKESFVYDTDPAAFDHMESSVSLPEVVAYPNGVGTTPTFTVPRSFAKRAQAGTARVRSRSQYDTLGNMLASIREGCVEGCPNGVDEVITATSEFTRPSGDVSGWIFRENHSYVTGSVTTAPRHETFRTYNAQGKLLETRAVLSGTLPLDRFQTPPGPAIAPAPPNASGGATAPVQILVEQNTYDPVFGRLTSVKGANGRCSSSDSDFTYRQVTIESRVFVGSAGPDGCGTTVLTTKLASTPTAYDRGLELTVEVLDPNLQPSRAQYDGFGRVRFLWGPDPGSPGSYAQQPSIQATYGLPTDPVSTPYTITILQSQDGPDVNTPAYRESGRFTDGLGRTIASVNQANHDAANPADDYMVSGAVVYNAKGGVRQHYLEWFQPTPPASFNFAAAPPSNYTSAEYDAFGRVKATYGLDHSIRSAVRYHALSQDNYDAADLQGPRANTHATVVSDGHGRGVQQIFRIRVGTPIESRYTLNEYLPTGEIRRVVQRKAGATDVVRWFSYDSLGRMVLNVEPNTAVGFDPNPGAPLANIKALRYAYDDAGDLVGTSDSRGCGVNYHYDTGGRILAQDRSPCLPEHAPYTAPNLATGDGTEAFYRYDSADPENASIVDPAGQPLGVNTSLLLGRLVSVSGLGSKTVPRYDALGRTTGAGLRIVKPGAPSSTLGSRYAPRWYVQTTALDAMGRTKSATTGVTVPALYGSDGQSSLSFSYSKAGAITSIGGSYGTLFAGAVYTADGLLDRVTLGDAAATQRAFTYNVNRQISSVTTYRAAAPLWSTPPPGYTPPGPSEKVTQLELEHYGLKYDDEPDAPIKGPGNLWKIIDYRSDLDWPGSAKPVTREFTYDDLYRLTQAKYTRASGGAPDPWTSPYAAEVADPTQKPQPSPHVSFVNRVQQQDFAYDWLGNIQTTTDNENGFWDRSLGATTMGTPTSGPNQVRSASNRTTAPSSTRKGDLSVAADAAGNYSDFIIRRDGPCLPTAASCWQRFRYEWNEIGQLARARRWDLTTAERTANGTMASPLPTRAPDAELRFAYDAGGNRTLKTAVDAAGVQRHTVYIFGGLELRSTSWDTAASPLDYDQSPDKVQLRLPAGIATARIMYSNEDLPTLTSGHLHVLLELADHIGSSTFVIDRATGELVEAATYQAYGAAESDYRPGRWSEFREPYRFSGKEEDIELGLSYFGARYYSPYLTSWLSPDPASIHEGKSSINPYEYVHGTPLMGTDPDGRFFFLLPVAIIVGSALIASATSVAVQAATVGWDHIDWGLKGVAGAAITGAVAGAVTMGAGAVIGNALSASTSLAGGLATGAISGAIGAGASYVTSSALAGQKMSWSGFGKAVAMGGAGGLAGAAAGIGGSALTRALGGSQGLAAVIGSNLGGVAGAGGSLVVGLAFGDQVSGSSMALSLGAGLAGAMASHGWGAAAKGALGDSASNGPSTTGPTAETRPPVDPAFKAQLAEIQEYIDGGEKDWDVAVRKAAQMWDIDVDVVFDRTVPKELDAVTQPKADGTVYIRVGVRGMANANWLASTLYHENVHVGQWRSGNWAGEPEVINKYHSELGHAVMECQAYSTELTMAERLGLTESEIGRINTRHADFYGQLTPSYRERVDHGNYLLETDELQ